jgi:hypothetical protein
VICKRLAAQYKSHSGWQSDLAVSYSVMNDTTPILVRHLSLLKSRYRKRKPEEKRIATGVISVVVISVVVIIPLVIATASGVVIATASAVGVAPSSAVGTSTRVVICSVCLARGYSDYC